MGYEPTFFGVDGMDGILGVENFDTSLTCEGVMLLTPFAADAKMMRNKEHLFPHTKRNMAMFQTSSQQMLTMQSMLSKQLSSRQVQHRI